MALTENQKRFCDYYIETGNATEAYERAGYKVKDREVAKAAASRLLTNVNLKQYIDQKMYEKDKSRIASQDEILETLTKIMRGEIVESIPIGVGMGAQELVDNTPSIKDRIKAAENLGKRYGMWTEKIEHSGNVVTIVDDIR